MRVSKVERDASFAEFMDQAGPALLRTAWFLTGDTDRAQELTQAALVKTYLVWDKIDRDSPLAYARRCLVNHKIDVWRATRHEVVADLTSSGLEALPASRGTASRSNDTGNAITDHRDDLVRRLSRLPEQQRKIVVLRLGTGYSTFSVVYKNGEDNKEATRPAEIASISWSGHTGIVDGIEGDHRLSGQILTFDSSASEKLVLRPGKDGRTTVSGEARLITSQGGYSTPQSVATTDASGVAVITGRYPVSRRVFVDATHKQKGWYVGYDGAPIAAGVLPPGASNIGVILTTDEVARGLPIQERLPDGSVIFAIKAESAHPSNPSKDSIKAVTWTNADGSQGRKEVTQQKQT